MSASISEIAIILGVVLGIGGLIMVSVVSIRYEVDPTHLVIRWLGIGIRKIPLEDIKTITTKPVFWAERWYNTLVVRNRMLVIRLRRGWIQNVVITPKNPFVFRTELYEARRIRIQPRFNCPSQHPGTTMWRRIPVDDQPAIPDDSMTEDLLSLENPPDDGLDLPGSPHKAA